MQDHPGRPTPDSVRQGLVFGDDGGLGLHGQPMILMPRHFFIYIMENVQRLAGAETFAAIYRRAGYDGAVTFCRRFREVHGCSATQAVEGYLAEMSVRGWGQYRVLRFDVEALRLEVLLVNSALRHARVEGSPHLVWVAAMEGAVAFLAESQGNDANDVKSISLAAEEVPPGPEDPPGACRIRVEPRRT